jgi:hypothetical protein
MMEIKTTGGKNWTETPGPEFPGTIKFGSIVYEVIITDNLQDSDNRQACDGQIEYRKGLIRLQSDQASDVMRSVLLHEVVHGVAHYADVELNERQVQRMALVLGAVLLDNQEFLELWKI